MVFGFQREADDPAAAFLRAERGDDIVGFDEMQIDRLAGLGDLVRLDAHGPIIARGGGADQAVARFEFLRRRGEHVFGGNHRHDARLRRILNLDRAADDHDFMPERERRLGQRPAHAAAGSVREIAHRVEELARRAGGDENAGQWIDHGGHGEHGETRRSKSCICDWHICRLCAPDSVSSVVNLFLFEQQPLDRRLDIGRLGHAAHAGAAAALPAFLRVDEVVAVVAERVDVALDGRLLPHRAVHRGGEHDRAGEREEQRAEQVVR